MRSHTVNGLYNVRPRTAVRRAFITRHEWGDMNLPFPAPDLLPSPASFANVACPPCHCNCTYTVEPAVEPSDAWPTFGYPAVLGLGLGFAVNVVQGICHLIKLGSLAVWRFLNRPLVKSVKYILNSIWTVVKGIFEKLRRSYGFGRNHHLQLPVAYPPDTVVRPQPPAELQALDHITSQT